ncbi:hypothetical protein GGX14DRAFT_651444 [Mycena pura]|uniref:Uncharacterized protein n=1 Tax=Mycena pura TaxID=153505 RepID=A0AAD6V9I0_9AGAR|nr:hypothetical protein GGX14DRAFT_651444 [Mycena pura]
MTLTKLFKGRAPPPRPTRAEIEEQAERDAQNHAADAEEDDVPDDGTVEIPSEDESINLDGEASEEELEQLAAVCDPAPFGLDDKDVLDEKVRKAGKIDVKNLSARLDVSAAGIIDAIIPEILSGEKRNRVLRAEMYKLNLISHTISGPGPHQDTPRAQNMIGSLVIFFPTAHEGGELVLTHGEDKFTYDSAAELRNHRFSATSSTKSCSCTVDTASPSPTTSSSITQNPAHSVCPTFPRRSSANSSPGISLLNYRTFLPKGGFIGFGLAYKYPMPTVGAYQLPPMLHLLKGRDARIRTAATRLGLPVHSKIVYDAGWWGDQDTTVLMDHPVNAEGHVEDMAKTDIARITGKGVTIREDAAHSRRKQLGSDSGAKTVHWVTPANKMMRIQTPSGSYFGNHGGVDYIYGDVALFVEIPAVGDGVRAKYLWNRTQSRSNFISPVQVSTGLPV